MRIISHLVRLGGVAAALAVSHTALSDDRGSAARTGLDHAVADLALRLVWISPGEFLMGSEDSDDAHERPVTRVRLTSGFWLGRTEVTQAQWSSLMEGNPSKFPGADRPVEQVSHAEALEFCRRLTAREQQAGRLPAGFAFTLPTEAQWEYACRAGGTGDYAGELAAHAWYAPNSGGGTKPVGTKEANAWGLHDMHGNVWEFCLGRYGPYPGGTAVDPAGAESGPYGIFRGGGWNSGPVGCRARTRHGYTHGVRSEFIGFRVALTAAPAG